MRSYSPTLLSLPEILAALILPNDPAIMPILSRASDPKHLGCSGYRIDLGVVDPAAPGHYLLGIECDGATYHRAATARDRDKLRQRILEDLGWKLHRVWSTDWWHDANKEMDKLVQRLKDLHPIITSGVG